MEKVTVVATGTRSNGVAWAVVSRIAEDGFEESAICGGEPATMKKHKLDKVGDGELPEARAKKLQWK
jgi:hypothetical protein